MLRSPTLTAVEARHVDTVEYISLIWNSPINVNTISAVLPRPQALCGHYEHSAVKRSNVLRGHTLVGKQRRLAGPWKGRRTSCSKGYTHVRTCRHDTPRTVRRAKILSEDDPVLRASDSILVVDDPSYDLTREENSHVTCLDSVLEPVLSDGDPHLLACRPELPYDVGTLRHRSSAQLSEVIGPKDISASSEPCSGSPNNIVEAEPTPTVGIDVLSVTKVGQFGQQSKNHVWFCPNETPHSFSRDPGNGCDTQQFRDSTDPLKSVAPTLTGLDEFSVTTTPRDVLIRSTNRGPGNVGRCEALPVASACDPLANHSSCRPIVPSVRPLSLRRMSCSAVRAVRWSSVAEYTSFAFRNDCPVRYLPFEPGWRISENGTPMPTHLDFARSPQGPSWRLDAFLLVGALATCCTILLGPGALPNLLGLGSLCVHTLAWDPNVPTSYSGFGHAPSSSQGPNGVHPDLRVGASMWSDFGSNFEPCEVEAREGAATLGTGSWCGEGPAALPSTSFHNPSNTLVPQLPSYPPSHPVPLTNYGSFGPLRDELHDHPVSGVIPRHEWSVPASSGPIYDQGSSGYPVAPARLAPSDQQANALLPDKPPGMSSGSSSIAGLWQNASGQPTPSVGFDDSFQNVSDVGSGRQPEVPGFDSSEPTIAHRAPAVPQNPMNQQFPYDNGHLFSSHSLPIHDANFAPISSKTVPSQSFLAPLPCGPAPPSSPAYDEDRKHVCSICNKPYRRPYLLRDHMKSSHKGQSSGGDRYRCDNPECQLTFATRSNMKRHYKKKHPNVANPPNPSSPPDTPIATRQHDQDTHSVEPGAPGDVGSHVSVSAHHPPGSSADVAQRTSAWSSWETPEVLNALNGLSPFADDYADQFLDNLMASNARQPRQRARRVIARVYSDTDT